MSTSNGIEPCTEESNPSGHVQCARSFNGLSFSELGDVRVVLDAIYKIPVDHETPLHQAVKNEDCCTIEKCSQHSVPINARDNQGKTALHYAMTLMYHSIVMLLVFKGADLLIKDKEGVTPWDLADDVKVMAVLNFFDPWSDTFNKLLESLWRRGRVVLWDGCNPQVSAVASANSCRMKKLHARPDTRENINQQYTSGVSVAVPVLKADGKSFVVLDPSSTDDVSLLIEITETPQEDSMQVYTTSFRQRETGRIMTLKLHESIQATKLIPCGGTNMVICPDLGPRPVTENFVPIVGYIVDRWFALAILEDIDTKMRLIFQREDLPPEKIAAPSQLQYNQDETGQENLTISAGIETMPTRYSIANYKEPECPKLEDLRVDPVESLTPLGRVEDKEVIQKLIRFIHNFTGADLLSGRREDISPEYVVMNGDASGN